MIKSESLATSIPEKTYFSMVFALSGAAFNHLIFLGIFYYFEITVLFYFNIISVVLFFSLILLLSKKLITTSVMMVAATEILIHQMLAVPLVGWDYGFQYYLLIVPGTIVLGEFKNKMLPVLFAVLSLITLLILFLLSNSIKPVFEMSSIQNILYIYNLMSAATLLAIFGGIFAYKSQKYEGDLLDAHFEHLELLKELELSNKETKDANVRKTRFLASASHDLRQPVHALELFSEALQDEPLSRKGKRTLAYLKESVASLNELLMSLLDISRLDAGIIKPSFEKIDISTVMNRLSNNIKTEVENKGLKLRIRSHSVWVLSDATLLENTLRNLLVNAIKYTDNGGILFACRQRKGEIWIDIWDSGKGIPEQDMRYILDEFYQVSNAQRDRKQGLGLGLSIVSREVNILGHLFSIYSREGRGTLARVKLKTIAKSQGIEAENLGASVIKDRLEGNKILIIDDDESILIATKIVLEKWGCNIKTATNFDDATVLCRDFIPDIIISDFRLREEVTGIDVIKKIREQLGAEVPAILITGDTAPDRLRQAQESGLVLLHKPVHPAKLRVAINMTARNTIDLS